LHQHSDGFSIGVTPVSPPPDDPPDSSSAPATGSVATAADAEAPPESGIRPRNAREALVAFMGSARADEGLGFIRGVIVRRLYGDNPEGVDEELVKDIAAKAAARAIKTESPPWTVGGVRPWVARLTICAIADYFRYREREKGHVDHSFDISNYFDRRAPGTDWGAQAHLVCKWLERHLGDDPFRRETFRMMYLHNCEDYSLADLAKQYRTTPEAVASRMYRLSRELGPKAKLMHRENARRAIIIFFFGAGVAVLVAIFALVVWPLLRPAPQPHAPPIPATPVPSASASAGPAPSFDQAVPTDDDSVPSDAGTRKQQGRQK
jgi:DNA-directed RNA polymerase specialized sigma24 family protein